MRMRRLGHRRDGNHDAIANEFRRLGASVTDTHMIGDGFPDIVVGHCGLTVLVEIKDGARPPSERGLTEGEKRWHDGWRGSKAVVDHVGEVSLLLDDLARDALLLAAGGSHPA